MMRYAIILIVAASFTSLVGPAWAGEDYDGILGLSSSAEHSCVAVALPVTPGQAISGISWVHNDANVTFPNLLVLEGTTGGPPDLTETALVVENVSGESLAWSTITFESAITSSADAIYAVFQVPAFSEKTGEGLDGGPGIGFVQEEGLNATYFSLDGTSWSRLHPNYSLRVEIVSSLAKSAGGTATLADLRESRPAGWWDELRSREATEVALESDGPAAVVSASAPMAVMPNPFNPRTTVQFFVQTPGRVQIDVFDVRGRRVRGLLQKNLSAGVHEAIWQGVDDRGASVASGVYFLRMKTPDGIHMQRAALVR